MTLKRSVPRRDVPLKKILYEIYSILLLRNSRFYTLMQNNLIYSAKKAQTI